VCDPLMTGGLKGKFSPDSRAAIKIVPLTHSAALVTFGAPCFDDSAFVVVAVVQSHTVAAPPLERNHCACECKSMCESR
jgi:hypothetical protein